LCRKRNSRPPGSEWTSLESIMTKTVCGWCRDAGTCKYSLSDDSFITLLTRTRRWGSRKRWSEPNVAVRVEHAHERARHVVPCRIRRHPVRRIVDRTQSSLDAKGPYRISNNLAENAASKSRRRQGRRSSEGCWLTGGCSLARRGGSLELMFRARTRGSRGGSSSNFSGTAPRLLPGQDRRAPSVASRPLPPPSAERGRTPPRRNTATVASDLAMWFRGFFPGQNTRWAPVLGSLIPAPRETKCEAKESLPPPPHLSPFYREEVVFILFPPIRS
jgi:hypothetical protein